MAAPGAPDSIEHYVYVWQDLVPRRPGFEAFGQNAPQYLLNGQCRDTHRNNNKRTWRASLLQVRPKRRQVREGAAIVANPSTAPPLHDDARQILVGSRLPTSSGVLRCPPCDSPPVSGLAGLQKLVSSLAHLPTNIFRSDRHQHFQVRQAVADTKQKCNTVVDDSNTLDIALQLPAKLPTFPPDRK